MNQFFLLKRSVLLFCFFISLNAFSQLPTFTWGPPVPGRGKHNVDTKVIGMIGDKFYSTYTMLTEGDFPTKEYFLEGYSGEFNMPLFTLKLSAEPDVINAPQFNKIIVANNKIYVFSTLFSKAEKKNKLLVEEVSPEGKKSPAKELLSIASEKSPVINFEVAISDDKNRIVVLDTKPIVKEQKEQAVIYQFDNNLTSLGSKEVTFSNVGHKSIVNKLLVNNNGNVFILKKIPAPKYTYTFTVACYNPETAKLTETNINKEGVSPLDVGFVNDKEQNVVAAGFYSENLNETVNGPKSHGHFYYKFDKQSGEQVIGSVNKYTTKLLETFVLLKANAEGKGLRYTEFKTIVFDNDNTPYLLGELAWENQVNIGTDAKGFAIYGTDCFNDNVLIVKFTKEGAVQWEQTLNKNEKSKNDKGNSNSFTPFIKDNRLAILFKDAEINHNEKKEVITTNMRQVVVLATFDNSGVMSVAPIWESGTLGKTNLKFRPAVYYIVSEKEVIVNSKVLAGEDEIGHNNYCFGRAKF